MGRVWYGWLYPLGTLLEWLRFRSHRRQIGFVGAGLPTVSAGWRIIKNLLLLLILAAALFGNLSLLILDPLTLFTRTMTTAVIPALNYGVTAIERTFYAVLALRPAVDWLERLLRGPVHRSQVPVRLAPPCGRRTAAARLRSTVPGTGASG